MSIGEKVKLLQLPPLNINAIALHLWCTTFRQQSWFSFWLGSITLKCTFNNNTYTCTCKALSTLPKNLVKCHQCIFNPYIFPSFPGVCSTPYSRSRWTNGLDFWHEDGVSVCPESFLSIKVIGQRSSKVKYP